MVAVGGTTCTTSAEPGAIASGATMDIVLVCDSGLTAGDNFKGDVTIKYARGSSSIALTSTGSISTTVV